MRYASSGVAGLSGLALLLAGSVVAPVALSQDNEAQGEQLEEEVYVSARKREENVMEIPVSVSVVDADLIQEAQLTSLEDIALVTPGFKLNNAFGRQADRPIIRGLSAITTGIELAGFFVDGIYVAGSLKSFDLESLERVEIIKGPQAAVFGRRTLTGAVNYITKRPTEETEVNLKAEFGSNGYSVGSITASGTRGRLGYRTTARYYSYDGDFGNALDGGPDVSGEETLSFNGTLFYDIADATSLMFNVSYADDDDDQYAIVLQGSDENNCTFDTRDYYCGTIEGDDPVNLGGLLPNDAYGVQRERLRTALRLEHAFTPTLDLSLTAAYNKLDYYAGQDQSFDGNQLAFSFATFGFGPATDWHTLNWSETEDVSFEGWLRGRAAGDRLDWSLGFYYYDEDDESFGNDASGVDPNSSKVEIQNTAFMAGAEYEFNDKFTAGAEVRYAEDEIDPNLDVAPGGETFDSWTYRVTGSYFVNDAMMIYGNVSTGTLPGDFNTDARLPDNLVPIDEQELELIELGVKTDLNEAVSITAAAYTMEWKDQRRSQFIIIDGTPVSYNANQGTTDIDGIEASVDVTLTDNIDAGVSFSYNDSEVNDFVSDDATDVAITGDGDVSGAQLPLSPDKEAHAYLTYRNTMQNGTAFDARVDWSFQDSRYVRLANQAEVGSATVVNLSLGWTADRWSVRLWGKNLTDEDAPVSALRYIEADSFFFGGRAFAYTPRPGVEYGVSGTVKVF